MASVEISNNHTIDLMAETLKFYLLPDHVTCYLLLSLSTPTFVGISRHSFNHYNYHHRSPHPFRFARSLPLPLLSIVILILLKHHHHTLTIYQPTSWNSQHTTHTLPYLTIQKINNKIIKYFPTPNKLLQNIENFSSNRCNFKISVKNRRNLFKLFYNN